MIKPAQSWDAALLWVAVVASSNTEKNETNHQLMLKGFDSFLLIAHLVSSRLILGAITIKPRIESKARPARRSASHKTRQKRLG